MRHERFKIFIIYFVSFFLFSGLQMLLVGFYAANITSLSRALTVPLRLLLLGLMFYFIIKEKKSSSHFNKINFISFSLFTLLYIFKVFYSEANSYDNPELSRKWYEYIFYFLSFNFFIYLFFSKVILVKYGKYVINAILVSGFLFGVFALYVYFPFIITGNLGRLSYLKYETGEDTINPLALAYSAVLNLSTILYINFQNKSRKIPIFYLVILIVVSLVMFFIGSSRGALLAMVIVILMLILTLKGKIKIFFIVALLILSPVIVFVNQFTGSDIVDRSSSAIENNDDSGRGILRKEAINEFIEHPLFGGQIEVSGMYPHNIFIEVLMATGIIGFGIFIFFFISHIFKLYKAIKLNIDYSYFVLYMLINALVQYSFSGAIWGAILLFFSLGMINSLNFKNENINGV